MIMSENKGDPAATNPQPPLGAAPPAYPMPQFAPTPVPVVASPPAPVPLDPATAAAIGQQYRDQCEFDTSTKSGVTHSKFQYSRNALPAITSGRQRTELVALSRPS